MSRKKKFGKIIFWFAVVIQIIYSHFRIEYHHRVSVTSKKIFGRYWLVVQKSVTFNAILEREWNGKIGCSFYVKHGRRYNMQCNSQNITANIYNWPYETLQYIYMYNIHIFKRPRFIMKLKSIIRVILLRDNMVNRMRLPPF